MHNHTTITHRLIDNKLYVTLDSIIRMFKDDLLTVFSDPEKEELFSDYAKDRVLVLEAAEKQWAERLRNK
jgi:hypothetical protein